MYSKQDLINCVSSETQIIKHLVTKIPEGTLGYKPTENQRTTLELLQYLSHIIVGGADLVYQNDASIFGAYVERGTNTTLENFNEMMDLQLQDFITLINKFTDENIAEVINLFGSGEKSKGAYLIDFTVKHIAAYKMQLFLYIKSSGNTSIGTSNVWGGYDM